MIIVIVIRGASLLVSKLIAYVLLGMFIIVCEVDNKIIWRCDAIFLKHVSL